MSDTSSQWIIDTLLKGNDFSSKVTRIGELLEEYQDMVDPSFKGKAAIGTDLDRTMIYSDASMSVEENLTDDLLFKVVEMYKRKTLCFMTSPAYLNLELLNAYAYLIPVTTRTEEQFKRIKIPGTTQRDYLSAQTQYAVTSNGAKILIDGREDKAWSKKIKSKYGEEGAHLSEVEGYLKKFKNQSWLKNLLVAEKAFCYMVVDRAEMPENVVEELRAQMKTYRWNVSLQGRKMYFVPDFLDKGTTFKEIAERLNADYTMSSGDSLLDVPLMNVADIAFRPNHGELNDIKDVPKNIMVTKNHGIFAGEELSARFLAQVRSGL